MPKVCFKWHFRPRNLLVQRRISTIGVDDGVGMPTEPRRPVVEPQGWSVNPRTSPCPPGPPRARVVNFSIYATDTTLCFGQIDADPASAVRDEVVCLIFRCVVRRARELSEGNARLDSSRTNLVLKVHSECILWTGSGLQQARA